MGGAVITNDVRLRSVHIQHGILAQANPQRQEENLNNDAFVSRPTPSKKQKGFNPFSFAWGLVKGFVKEAINIILFIPKLVIGLITNPIGTIKGFANGFLALGKLLLNPSELGKVLKKAWEGFLAADSEKKGEIIGAILANVTTLPVTGNPLLLNARLLSTCRRFGVSIKAIAQNTNTLSRFYRMTGSRWKTFLAARRIAKKTNLQRDFERALRLEGIPRELAPKLRIIKTNPLLGAAYSSTEHTIFVNKRWLNIMPSSITGGFVRHEVKHAGQAILGARVGGTVPKIKIAKGMIVDFMTQNMWDKIYKTMPLKPGTKLYEKAKGMPKLFEKSIKRTRDVSNYFSSNKRLPKKINESLEEIHQYYIKRKAFLKTKPSLRKAMPKFPFSSIKESLRELFKALFQYRKVTNKYLRDILEVEARRVQARYTGLMPRIPTPSIHNLPRLAPLVEEKSEEVEDTLINEHNEVKGSMLNEAA